MPLGTQVLVLKGDARNDLGQMAIVSAIAGSQVIISYRGPTGQIKTRQKHRALLIPMEDGVELVVEAQCCPLIRATRGQGETEEYDEIGFVSEEDEI